MLVTGGNLSTSKPQYIVFTLKQLNFYYTVIQKYIHDLCIYLVNISRVITFNHFEIKGGKSPNKKIRLAIIFEYHRHEFLEKGSQISEVVGYL